ncbi:putative cytoplasmic protein [Streptococcus pneumoniae]|nr:putative cytoplasmic protein [Streptococcus pneumoniae]
MIRYLGQHEDVILREIKAQFPDVAVDKLMEEYIKAGLILRENKRYYLNFPTLESLDSLELDQEIFVREASLVYQALLEQSFETELRNRINAAILVEKTDFARTKMTLSNYFYKVKQQELYDILGDVNPEYALKYMTAFLLKFLKKDQLMQKRHDIFVDSLVVLGYIVQNQGGKYELAIDFDKERLTFYLV